MKVVTTTSAVCFLIGSLMCTPEISVAQNPPVPIVKEAPGAHPSPSKVKKAKKKNPARPAHEDEKVAPTTTKEPPPPPFPQVEPHVPGQNPPPPPGSPPAESM